MEYNNVKSRLFKIINTYIEDEIIRVKLLEDAKLEWRVRGVLYSLDEYKKGDLSEAVMAEATEEVQVREALAMPMPSSNKPNKEHRLNNVASNISEIVMPKQRA